MSSSITHLTRTTATKIQTSKGSLLRYAFALTTVVCRITAEMLRIMAVTFDLSAVDIRAMALGRGTSGVHSESDTIKETVRSQESDSKLRNETRRKDCITREIYISEDKVRMKALNSCGEAKCK